MGRTDLKLNQIKGHLVSKRQDALFNKWIFHLELRRATYKGDTITIFFIIICF